MTIKLYGETVEKVSRNDLHNTYSVKNHVPHYVPGYKRMYLNQLNNNKILLWTIGLSWLFCGLLCGGTFRAKNTEIEASKQAESKCMNAYLTSEQSYNEAVSILLNKGDQTPEQIINTIFGKDAPLMTKIAYCESHLNPKAANKTSSARGLFQIMASVHQVKETWLYDPTINTLIAKKLFDASGTNPWVSSIACWSK